MLLRHQVTRGISIEMTTQKSEKLNVTFAPTTFYPLVPKGVGTLDCESILSYMARLAAAHRVSLNALCEFVREQTPDADWSSWHNPVLNLSLRVPDSFLETVIRLTGQPSLWLCTFDRIYDLVHLRKSKNLRVQRHCPICVKQAPFPGGWNRLLWTVDIVEACPEHGVVFSDTRCGADRKQWVYQSDRAYLPCVCRSCRKNAFACRKTEVRTASAQQIWVARQVGELVAAMSEGEVFDAESLRTGIDHIIRNRWRNTSDAARSLGLAFTTVSLAATGSAPVSLRLLVSLCSAVDIKLVDLLRGRRVAIRKNCNPVVFPRYFRAQRRPRKEGDLRLTISRILQEEPHIGIVQLADRIGVQTTVFYQKLPDVVQQLREDRLKRRAFERWKGYLRLARKLRSAKRQLDGAGRQFTTVSVFQCVRVVPRSDAEIRLFQFVRDYF